jgi:hypothetical protein
LYYRVEVLDICFAPCWAELWFSTQQQEAVEQQISEIEKLNAIINGLEREMLRLKARYETAIEGIYHCALCL